MHGGALEIVYGPPSPPQSVMLGGNAARPQGPARKKPNNSCGHKNIHHMIARDGFFTASVSGNTRSLTYWMEYDLMSNDQLFGNSLPPPLSGTRS